MSGRNYEDGLFIGPNGDPNAVNDTTPFASGQLGKTVAKPFTTKVVNTTVADFDLGTNVPRVIKYVQRVTNATETNNPVVGDVAYWNVFGSKVASNTGNAIGNATTSMIAAGVFLGDAGLTPKCVSAGNYGFIQVAGVAPIRVSGSIAATSIGAPLIVSTTEGKVVQRVGVIATTQQSVNDAQANVMLVGYALTSTTVSDGTGFVQCLLALPPVAL